MVITNTEFMELYSGMRRYATIVARDYFRDEGQLEMAVDSAMDTFTDWWMEDKSAEHPVAYVKTIIRNAIKQESKKRKFERGNLNWPGMEVLKKVNKNKPMKVRIQQIKGSAHDVMKLYSEEGMSQVEIRKITKLSKGYVSDIVKKYTI